MRFPLNWLIFGLLLAGSSLSLPALAQSELRTPNCDNPQAGGERKCCVRPTRCESRGFERPPLLTVDCNNARGNRAQACCENPSTELCEDVGFKQPAAVAPAAAAEPVPKPPSDAAGDSAIQVGRVPRLSKDQLESGAIADGMLGGTALADADIFACGGTRDPVFRENATTMNEVRTAATPSLLAFYMEQYDNLFDGQIARRASGGCRGAAVEQTYDHYLAQTFNYILETSATLKATNADVASTQAAPAAAPSRGGQSAQTAPLIVTTPAGEPYDCRHRTDRTLFDSECRSLQRSANSPYNSMAGAAGSYQRLAEICGDPSGARIREDALSRLVSAPLLEVNREELIQVIQRVYEANAKQWADERQNVQNFANYCAVWLPRRLRGYDLSVEAVVSFEQAAARSALGTSAVSPTPITPTAEPASDVGTPNEMVAIINDQLKPRLEDALGVSLTVKTSTVGRISTGGGTSVSIEYTVDGGYPDEADLLSGLTGTVESFEGTVQSVRGAGANRIVGFKDLKIGGVSMGGMLSGTAFYNSVTFQGGWGGQSRYR